MATEAIDFAPLSGISKSTSYGKQLIFLPSSILKHWRCVLFQIIGKNFFFAKTCLNAAFHFNRNFTQFCSVESLWKLTASAELRAYIRKLCVSTRFLRQETGWNFSTLCSTRQDVNLPKASKKKIKTTKQTQSKTNK